MTSFCDVTGREYDECAVRHCPHPAVLERFGYDGQVRVCIYVCRKCDFGQTEVNFDAVRCGYKEV